jgi:hypothetical protein
VRLRGGQEAVDLLEPVAVGERSLEPALVGDQDADCDLRWEPDRLEDLLGVRQLGDHVRPDKAGDLDALKAGGSERLDQPHLLRRGEDLRLVLKAVTGTDLADANVNWEIAHEIDSMNGSLEQAPLPKTPQPQR